MKRTELETINPATEEILNRYTIMTKEEINAAVKKSQDEHLEWKKDSHKRIDLLHDFAQELRRTRKT